MRFSKYRDGNPEGSCMHTLAVICLMSVLSVCFCLGLAYIIQSIASDRFASKLALYDAVGADMLQIVKQLDETTRHGGTLPSSIHAISTQVRNVRDPYANGEAYYYSVTRSPDGEALWVLASVGPDRLLQTPYDVADDASLPQYVPSRGLKSRGDVIFTSTLSPPAFRIRREEGR